MKKYLLMMALIFAITPFIHAQEQSTQDQDVQKELERGLSEMKETLKHLEIPEINLEEITAEIEKVMPSKEQLNSAKSIMTDAIEEIEKIDLKPLMGILEELKNVFEDQIPASTQNRKI